MSPSPQYILDRTLTAHELSKLAKDMPKIPGEMIKSLEMRFTATQHSAFYQGFIVASLDVFFHLKHPDSPDLALGRVRFIAAGILHHAGHLFRKFELPYPTTLVEKLRGLPPSCCSAIQQLPDELAMRHRRIRPIL